MSTKAQAGEAASAAAGRLDDQSAARLKELVARLQPALLRIARSLTPSLAVAEEVVQESWVAVVERLPEFRGESSLKSWIFAIVTKRAITRAKLEGRSLPFSALEADDGEDSFDDAGDWLASKRPGRWSAGPEEEAITRERLKIVEAAMERLPAAQRAVVTLRDIEGLSAAETCNILEVTETNQRVLLHRARCALRKALNERESGPPPKAARAKGGA